MSDRLIVFMFDEGRIGRAHTRSATRVKLKIPYLEGVFLIVCFSLDEKRIYVLV